MVRVVRCVGSIGLVFVLALACAGNRYKTNAHVDTAYDFSEVDSFAFAPQREKTAQSEAGKVLEAKVREELASRGYEEVEADDADVLVSFEVGQYAPAKLSGSSSFAITEGTLTITVLDPETRRTVWYGWVETRLRNDDTDEVIGEAVDALFEGRIPDAPGADSAAPS